MQWHLFSFIQCCTFPLKQCQFHTKGQILANNLSDFECLWTLMSLPFRIRKKKDCIHYLTTCSFVGSLTFTFHKILRKQRYLEIHNKLRNQFSYAYHMLKGAWSQFWSKMIFQLVISQFYSKASNSQPFERRS